MNYRKVRVLVLDMDGTVRQNRHNKKSFINDIWDIELVPGVEDAIMKYRDQGWYITGATNQGGVAFGYKTEEQVIRELEFTFDLFLKNPFSIIAYSICHANGKEPLNVRSLLRKPNYGMLAHIESQMLQEYLVPDWDNSLFVGNSIEDELCAKNAGVPYLHVNEFLKINHDTQ